MGVVLAVYYPWIALGGYTLSEPPFTLFLCAARSTGSPTPTAGSARDAWLFGGALALGAIFRPQILAALPLYALHALLPPPRLAPPAARASSSPPSRRRWR